MSGGEPRGRLLVTGATGFVGARLIDAAARRRWDVTGTFHARAPQSRAGAVWTRLELLRPDDAEATVRALAPDAVIHAAVGPVDASIARTARDGAVAVATAASASGARLVHVSTDVVFDGRLGRPYREDDAPTPLDPYGAAKAEAESSVLRVHPGACVVRTSLVLAEPGDAPGRHERLVLDALAGERDVRFFTDELRCPVAVSDLAAALLEVLELDCAGPLHVAGTDAVSRFELARLVASSRGLDPERVRGARSADGAVRRGLDCRLDVSRARALLRSRLRGARELLTGGRSGTTR